MRRVLHRIGRRGASLLWFGLLDLIIGFSLLDSRSWPKGAATTAYAVVVAVAPYYAWGMIWTVVGLVCLVQAFMHDDRAAFGAAIGLKAVWGACFVGSWLLYDAYRGFLSVAIWWSMAAFVGIIAGWPEPVRVVRPDITKPDQIGGPQ